MTAFEKRMKAMHAQYEMVKCMIEEAKAIGYVEIEFALDKAVAERLEEEGYDGAVIKTEDPRMSYSIINWNEAEEGRKGQIVTINQKNEQTNPMWSDEKYFAKIIACEGVDGFSTILDVIIAEICKEM